VKAELSAIPTIEQIVEMPDASDDKGYVVDFSYRQTQPHRYRWLYFIRNVDTGRIKIGVANNVESRLHDLEMQSGSEMELLGSIRNASELECILHIIFRESRARGEWFEPSEALLRIAKRPSPERIMALAKKGEEAGDYRLIEHKGFLMAFPWKKR
jgi:hypothetical protein